MAFKYSLYFLIIIQLKNLWKSVFVWLAVQNKWWICCFSKIWSTIWRWYQFYKKNISTTLTASHSISYMQINAAVWNYHVCIIRGGAVKSLYNVQIRIVQNIFYICLPDICRNNFAAGKCWSGKNSQQSFIIW